MDLPTPALPAWVVVVYGAGLLAWLGAVLVIGQWATALGMAILTAIIGTSVIRARMEHRR